MVTQRSLDFFAQKTNRDGASPDYSDPLVRVVEADGRCWEWLGYRDHFGYGKIWDGSHKVGVHRFSYVQHKGEIPKGFHVDHLCRNPPCVNPRHLEAVTPKENGRRGAGHPGVHPSVAKCPLGRSYDLVQGDRRRCRACKGVATMQVRANKGMSAIMPIPTEILGEIRAAINGGNAERDIKRRFGVTRGLIARVRRGTSLTMKLPAGAFTDAMRQHLLHLSHGPEWDGSWGHDWLDGFESKHLVIGPHDPPPDPKPGEIWVMRTTGDRARVLDLEGQTVRYEPVLRKPNQHAVVGMKITYWHERFDIASPIDSLAA